MSIYVKKALLKGINKFELEKPFGIPEVKTMKFLVYNSFSIAMISFSL
jgi:hypothetical protein